MRTRSLRGGLVLVVAATLVAALVASASGAVRSSPQPVKPAARTYEYPRGERERLAYERMNQVTEELRIELNRPDPDASTVADLKAKLRLLANRS